MNAFERAFRETVVGIEGVYSNRPDDPGGETVFGISRVYWPNWPGWQAVDAAKGSPEFPHNLVIDPVFMANVQLFYKEKFWNAVLCDRIPFDPLAAELFDTAVNVGTFTTVRFLQVGLNRLNKLGTLWPDIKEDGLAGPATEAALDAAMQRVKPVHAVMCDCPGCLLTKAVNCQQGVHYLTNSREQFVPGLFAKRIH